MKSELILYVMLDFSKDNYPVFDYWSPEELCTDLSLIRKSNREEAMRAVADCVMSPRRIPGRMQWVLWTLYEPDSRQLSSRGVMNEVYLAAVDELLKAAHKDLFKITSELESIQRHRDEDKSSI